MKQFVIDGNNVILAAPSSTERVDEVVFRPNEVYTVDIALTKGSGKTRDIGTRTTVYRRNLESRYMVKMKASRAVLSEVDRRFPSCGGAGEPRSAGALSRDLHLRSRGGCALQVHRAADSQRNQPHQRRNHRSGRVSLREEGRRR